MKKFKWLLFLCVAYLFSKSPVYSASNGILKTGDVLTITVKGEPELTGDRLITSDGSINFPLIGSVGVSGMKTTDVEKVIKQQLEDGFLQNPVVTVSISNKPYKSSSSQSITDSTYNDDISSDESDEQILIELRDKSSEIGIGNSVISVGNKVYQTNRLGQVLVKKSNAKSVIIADGYKTLSGSLNNIVQKRKTNGPSYILMEKLPINENVLCTVIDESTNKPVKHAEINLDGRSFVSNNQGEFRIKDNKREFSELTIKKRCFKEFRKIIDYKGPSTLTFVLSK